VCERIETTTLMINIGGLGTLSATRPPEYFLEVQMNVSEAIKMKRAVRKFLDKPLPDDVVTAILNAGRRSQSSKNNQAWQFVVIREKSTLKELSQCGEWAGHIAGAALCVAILTPDPA
jgi:nitroreductase